MAPLSLLFTAVLTLSAYAYNVHRVEFAASGKAGQIPPAQFSVSLTEKVSRPAYKRQMLSALGSNAANFTAIVDASGGENEYLTDIKIGGQSFKVIVDTGS